VNRKSQALRPPAFGYRSIAARRRATELYCEGVFLESLATRYGTPLYVYSAAMICARLKASLARFVPFSHAVLFGQGQFDAGGSATKWPARARASTWFPVENCTEFCAWAGRRRARLCLGSGQDRRGDGLALRSGILLFNIGKRVRVELAFRRPPQRLKKRAAVAVRVNPEVSAKTHPYISTGLHQHKSACRFRGADASTRRPLSSLI